MRCWNWECYELTGTTSNLKDMMIKNNLKKLKVNVYTNKLHIFVGVHLNELQN